ncbi:hypothetical protein W97_00742 [Coniosporium apollinis CBS 100218]|uniref:NAD(P)-binding domain-containing protein n=1 Tax=Coniosporium apollinis (strain CBS 100218) TaxID=1168221 RepID=R7YI00_CONA1|nr:uncharacterized protein W97_00742 [Coniosporium apollinis CBS 100218]EON61527.1 hypothetical protein W97_00742 [Coniosporium apollinis CBS 100218]
MHLILVGATGLVGSAVLSHLLSLPASQIGQISILTRRPVPLAEGHPHVKVIEHHDFTCFPPELLYQLKGADGCIWALGTSQDLVSKEEYTKITVDYTIAAAKAFSTLSDPFKFVFVSADGATEDPGTLTPFFLRAKGQAESALLALRSTHPSLRPYSLRPGFVDKSSQPELSKWQIQRPMPLLKKLIPVLGPIYRTIYPSGTTPTPQLGKVLTDLAMGDGEHLEGSGIVGGGRIITNLGFRRLAEL